MREPGESRDERQARLRRNEAIFRAVNEGIEGLHATFAVVAHGGFAAVCECGDLTCVKRVLIQVAEYARVRADPLMFILVPGHDDATVEAVVEQDHGVYVVVRKYPQPERASLESSG